MDVEGAKNETIEDIDFLIQKMAKIRERIARCDDDQLIPLLRKSARVCMMTQEDVTSNISRFNLE